ncbi:MAG: endonuclease [Dehalococcoidia bacterium]|nr:endonuclease [Dehalococcoidia bacterium]
MLSARMESGRKDGRTKARTASLWPVGEVLNRLAPLYGPARSPRIYDGISELVYTVLSQNTADTNSIPAYQRLVATFTSWDLMADAPAEAVIEAIRQGGLARIKGPRIQAILREVRSRRGNFDLSFLAGMPLADAKAWLRSLPGVGPKTVGCVLLFALGMPALPVDTHVYRVAQRLGFIGPKVSPDQSHDLLEGMLEPDQVLPFHMYLINHGRKTCKAPRPLCGSCALEQRCPSSVVKVADPPVVAEARSASGLSMSPGTRV